jgi:hypothetical protein
MRYIILAITLGVFLCLGDLAIAAKGGHKGPSERAYERANENASFKRDKDWTPGHHEDGEKDHEDGDKKHKKHKHKDKKKNKHKHNDDDGHKHDSDDDHDGDKGSKEHDKDHESNLNDDVSDDELTNQTDD